MAVQGDVGDLLNRAGDAIQGATKGAGQVLGEAARPNKDAPYKESGGPTDTKA